MHLRPRAGTAGVDVAILDIQVEPGSGEAAECYGVLARSRPRPRVCRADGGRACPPRPPCRRERVRRGGAPLAGQQLERWLYPDDMAAWNAIFAA